MTDIEIEISKALLAKIEKDIKGQNKSEKVLKCVIKGFKKLTEKSL